MKLAAAASTVAERAGRAFTAARPASEIPTCLKGPSPRRTAGASLRDAPANPFERSLWATALSRLSSESGCSNCSPRASSSPRSPANPTCRTPAQSTDGQTLAMNSQSKFARRAKSAHGWRPRQLSPKFARATILRRLACFSRLASGGLGTSRAPLRTSPSSGRW